MYGFLTNTQQLGKLPQEHTYYANYIGKAAFSNTVKGGHAKSWKMKCEGVGKIQVNSSKLQAKQKPQ